MTFTNWAIKQDLEQVDMYLDFHAQVSICGATSAFDNRRQSNGRDYYGVQLDKNVWWWATFELPHETINSLCQYLNKMGILDIISLQSNGQTLHVEDVGVFRMEWHMEGILRNLKSMLGCKLEANTLFLCIYYCHSNQIQLKLTKAFARSQL